MPNRWLTRKAVLLAVVWLASAALVLMALGGLVFMHRYRAFKIPTRGMHPTLLAGDHLIADKSEDARRSPARTDLIVFLFPEDRSRVFIKRVIGLPGERVEVRGRAVSINGVALEEPYAYFAEPDESAAHEDWGPQTVPAGHLFVLGDNRQNSRDSRFWGYVPVGDVVAVPRLVYFSLDERSGGVRWSRIGHRVR
jgi:signal peptidase I